MKSRFVVKSGTVNKILTNLPTTSALLCGAVTLENHCNTYSNKKAITKMLCDGLVSVFEFIWLKIIINHVKLFLYLIFGKYKIIGTKRSLVDSNSK